MDVQQLKALKQAIPAFADSSENTQSEFFENEFQRYWLFYGFDCLAELYDGLQFGYISSGEHKVFCMRWTHARNQTQTHSQTRADAVVVHGLFDHVGLYVPLIQRLLQQGLNVVAFDLPEHGLSSGREGPLTSFSTYVSAFEKVLSEACSSLPRYALGQSTGAAVIMNYVLRRQASNTDLDLDRLILLAPLLRVVSWNKVRLSHQLLHRFIKRVPRKFLVNSHDAEFHTFLKERDPCQPKTISVPWVKAMLDWNKAFSKLRQCDVEGAIIQGTDDQTVDAAFNVPRIAAIFPKLEVSYIDGAHHHLVREAAPWREKVFRAIEQAVAPTSESD